MPQALCLGVGTIRTPAPVQQTVPYSELLCHLGKPHFAYICSISINMPPPPKPALVRWMHHWTGSVKWVACLSKLCRQSGRGVRVFSYSIQSSLIGNNRQQAWMDALWEFGIVSGCQQSHPCLGLSHTLFPSLAYCFFFFHCFFFPQPPSFFAYTPFLVIPPSLSFSLFWAGYWRSNRLIRHLVCH